MKRGPKPKPPEEKVVRKNVSLDEESLELLNLFQAELEAELGFKPTLAQCVKHLIRNRPKV